VGLYSFWDNAVQLLYCLQCSMAGHGTTPGIIDGLRNTTNASFFKPVKTCKMKILVTGASGYIGNNLAHTIANMGMKVHALIRSDAAKALLQHPNIEIFKGDILEKESLATAMKGCKQVYHTAARVGAWAKDPHVFYDVNVEGTRNVLEAAKASGVEKFVFTSTCGVIGPSLVEPMKEDDTRITGFGMDYDRSKKMGEDIVLKYAGEGLHAVIVCPSKVYGPGNISHSLTANAIIEKFLKKRIAFIPSPGTHKVCFAFLDDIVSGHVMAMEKGKSGEKYILGGVNISYGEFFERIRMLSACKGHIIRLSKNTINGWALLQMLNYKITGSTPVFTTKGVAYIFNNYAFSSEKANIELGYRITPLEEALTKTIRFLKHSTRA
jgi:nucleoside-diphosphate-sugar epimerase